MQRIFSLFLLILSGTFVEQASSFIAKAVSQSKKCRSSKEMKVVAFIQTMTFSVTLFARGIEHDVFDRFEHFKTLREIRQQQKSQAKKHVPKELDGRIRCANDSHSKNGNCDLEFVTKYGDALDIDENKVLGKRHCKNHKDLMVKLT